MFKNYLKIAFRNLMRNKAFTFINIAGLTFGLTCCLVLVLYLQNELSFDKFHTKADRIARVIMEYKIGSDGNKGNFTSTKVFPAFKRQFPEVESGVRISASSKLVRYGDKVFNEANFLFTDSTFFNVFDFNLSGTTANDALKAPKMLVLSRSSAERYFGKENPIGKTLLIGSSQTPFLVSGVTDDCPANSQIQYSMVASISTFGELQETTYTDANYTTYLLLNNANAFTGLQSKINTFMQSENKTSDFKVNFELEHFNKVHLYSMYDAFVPNSSIFYIYIIMGIALLILLIACFTYINLSTARSADRAKEVGIRKVAGAFRSQLFVQFISESLLVTVIAMIVSVLLLLLVLPAFNQLAATNLTYTSIFTPTLLGISITFVLVIGIVAGSYPAFILAKFQPVMVLKGSFKNTASGTILRKGLLVFQFSISVFLIIATLVIRSQMGLIQDKKLGFNRENIVVLDIDQKLVEKMPFVKNELKTIPAVKEVSFAYESPVKIGGGYNMSGTDLSKSMAVTANPIDENYVSVMGLNIIAGSNLTQQNIAAATNQDYTKNYYHFILNESAAKALGWNPQEAIGKKMYLDESRPGEVKAVVKDFHFASLHSSIKPLVLFPGGWSSNLFVKIDGKNTAATLASLKEKWTTLAPHRPYSFHFLDDDYQNMYESETRIGKVFNVFALLAIVLACLGLFGLSAYAAKQRIKEIGVRKVLGASVAQINLLLSAGFLKLVAIAFLIACPIAWFIMNKWLAQFSYRVSINWWIFGAAGLASLLIAFVTVSFQSIKAAIANPVKSLRMD